MFTQDQLEQVHSYTVQMQELQQNIQQLQLDIGGPLVNAVADAASWFSVMTSTIDAVIHHQADDAASAYGLGVAHVQMGLSALDAKSKLDQLTQSIHDQQAATDKMVNASMSAIDADLSKRQADLSVSTALQKLSDDQKVASTTVEQLTRDQLDAESQMKSAARASADLAAARAEESGATFTAGQKADAYRDALIAEASQLAPGSPLRVHLQSWIDELASVPRDINTRVTLTTSDTGYQNPGRQHGGEVVAGRVYTVGEGGHPETLVMYQGGGGMVIPSGGGGGGAAGLAAPTIGPVNVNGPVGSEEIARMIAGDIARELNWLHRIA